MKNIIEKHSEKFLLLGIFFWFFFIIYIKLSMYEKDILNSDIVLYMNAFYNTNFIDKWLYTDLNKFGYGIDSYFSDHFAPTLLLLIPLYKVFSSATLLILLQSIMPCISTLLIYNLSEQIIGKKSLSLIISLIYLFHPALRLGTMDSIYGFHHDCLAPPLIILLSLFLVKRKYLPFIITLLLLVGLKETFTFTTFLLGIGLFFIKPDLKKYGKVTIIISIIFFCIAFFLLPIMSGENYKHLSKIDSLFKLDTFINNLINYLPSYILFILPFFPALFSILILLILPDLFMYTFTSYNLTQDWHVFPSITITCISAIIGYENMMNTIEKINLKKYLHSFAYIIPVLVITLLVFTFINNNNKTFKFLSIKVDKIYKEELNIYKKIIPDDSYLMTTCDMAIHFANREHLVVGQVEKADFFLINLNRNTLLENDLDFLINLEKLWKNKKVAMINSTENIRLFKRIK